MIRMTRATRIALVAFAIAVALPSAVWCVVSALGWINRAVARDVAVCRGTRVRGRYWYVTLATVTSASIEDRKAIARGYTVKGFPFGSWTQEPAFAEHPLPDVELRDDPAAWFLFASTYQADGTEVRLRNKLSDEEVCVVLPKGNATPVVASAVSDQTSFVVVAAGEWKVGPPSYIALLEIPRPR